MLWVIIGLLFSSIVNYILIHVIQLPNLIIYLDVLVFTSLVAYLVRNFMVKKNLLKSKIAFVLAIIAIVLSLLQGFFFALIIPFYFSMLGKKQ